MRSFLVDCNPFSQELYVTQTYYEYKKHNLHIKQKDIKAIQVVQNKSCLQQNPNYRPSIREINEEEMDSG